MRKFLRRVKRYILKLITGRRKVEPKPFETMRISESDLAEIRHYFPRQKFFIFGHGRSGTTLLARLIRVHPEVHCNWQAHFFTKQNALINILATEELNTWLSRRSNRWTYDQGLLSPIVRIVCDYIMEREANRTGKRIVGDKSPDSSLDVAIPHLNCIYPDAHIIHIIRDGRDAVLSRRIQLFIDAPGVLDDADLEIRDAFLADREPFLRLERSLFTRRWLENAATRWAGNVRNTHEKGQDLYNDRYFWLRYEDLIGDPSAWLEKVWNFLGAEPATSELTSVIRKTMTENPAVAWQEKQAPEMVKDLKRGIAGGWQEMFTYDDRQLFERIAGEELASWGYEIGDG